MELLEHKSLGLDLVQALINEWGAVISAPKGPEGAYLHSQDSIFVRIVDRAVAGGMPEAFLDALQALSRAVPQARAGTPP